jgi:hypothetical protein
VRSLLEPGKLPALQHNVKSLHNRAVFEIADFLSTQLPENPAPQIASPNLLEASK